MMERMRPPATPRVLLALLLAPAALTVLAGCSSSSAPASPPVSSSLSVSAAASAPASVPASAPASGTAAACDPDATLVELTEGPYYTPGAPERTVLSDADTVGTPLVVTGTVYSADCEPVAGATLDVWQADGAGVYDNEGFALRGVQTTGPDGSYTITTVVPGIYPGRTEHIHFTVTPPGGPSYTSQLFFPGSEQNADDGIYVEEMEVTIDEQGEGGMRASFDVVLP